jgi:hypothetical protein
MTEQQQLEAAVLKDLLRVLAPEMQRARRTQYRQPAVDTSRREHAELRPYRMHRAHALKVNHGRKYSTAGLGSL